MTSLRPAGDIIVAYRAQQGITQEQLADRSKVGVRTIQRAEKGNPVRAENLTLIAEALGVGVALLSGSTSDVLDAIDIGRENMCRYCGARLSHRAYVDFEHGDVEVDQFECGAMIGWRDRPCPQDPRFPAFEDYEIRTIQSGDRYYSNASGRTEMARAVLLPSASGSTPESAERWLKRGYIRLRFGEDEAEKHVPFAEYD
jgi:transcriptional regulator with XRE-family HTH domain